MDDEKSALAHFLAAQRASVLAIVDGLDPAGLTAAVLPSGWTPLGLIEHLGHAERHWFQEILTGSADPLPWPDGHTPLRTSRSRADVVAFYRAQCARSDALPPRRRCRPCHAAATRTTRTARGRDHRPAAAGAAHDRGDHPARRAPGRGPGADRRTDRAGPALTGGARPGRCRPGPPG